MHADFSCRDLDVFAMRMGLETSHGHETGVVRKHERRDFGLPESYGWPGCHTDRETDPQAGPLCERQVGIPTLRRDRRAELWNAIAQESGCARWPWTLRKIGYAMPTTAILYEVQKLYGVSDRLDLLAEQHPLVSEALITISGSVRNTATLLEVLVATKITLTSGLD